MTHQEDTDPLDEILKKHRSETVKTIRDYKDHRMPRAASLIDAEAKTAINKLYIQRSKVAEAIENLNNLGAYEDWGTYGEGFDGCVEQISKALNLEENE